MDDFEEIKEGESVLKHLIAGAIAGTAEHCAMFPIDTIKTNMQAQGGPTGVMQTTREIMSRNGFVGLFRGVSALAAGAAPAHALHFATYEFCKDRFGGSESGHHPIRTAGAGICATIVSDAVLTPTDAVKQRMQLGIRNYKGMVDCFRTIIQSEGFFALYASYSTTLLMNIPYNALYFASYESLRRILKRGKESEFDVIAHCLAGGGAGAFAGALTTPFDVAKTRLQTQNETRTTIQDFGHSKHSPDHMHTHTDTKPVKYRGMVNTLQTIWKEEGKQGLLRGLRPRVALHSTSAAICWATYEYVKHLLAWMDNQH
mmetsp:Transcript_16724/g.23252  ORF Transcript_16724/g.23252 Transcript_16724/m.23252 type:complete len:315 (-) Transcript_16724:71-1015(-)